METQESLHEELKGKYSKYRWIDVYSKSDLEAESELTYSESVSVSVMTKTGLEELESRLIQLSEI